MYIHIYIYAHLYLDPCRLSYCRSGFARSTSWDLRSAQDPASKTKHVEYIEYVEYVARLMLASLLSQRMCKVNVMSCSECDIHCNSWHSLQLMTLTLSMSWDNAMRRWIWHSLQLITLTATHDIDIVDFLRQCHVTVNVTSTATHDFDCNSWHWHCQCQEKMSCAKFSPRQNLLFSKVWKIVCKDGNVFYFSHARAFFVSFSPHVYISPVLAKPETCGPSGEAKQIENFLIPWTLNKIDWRARFIAQNFAITRVICRRVALSVSLCLSLVISLSLSLSLSLYLFLACAPQPEEAVRCLPIQAPKPTPMCMYDILLGAVVRRISVFQRVWHASMSLITHMHYSNKYTHTFYKY